MPRRARRQATGPATGRSQIAEPGILTRLFFHRLGSMTTLRTVLVRLACAAFVGLALSACIELVPRDVEQSVVIHRDGRIEATYEGNFNDLSDLVRALAADAQKDLDEKVPDEDDYGLLIDRLKSRYEHLQIDRQSAGLYHVRWHEEGALRDDDLPDQLEARGEEKIPLLVRLQGFDQLSDTAFALRSDAQDKLDDDMPHDGSQTAKVLEGYLARFKGKVSVRIDPAMVLKHNARSAATEADGMLKLEWPLSVPMKEEIELLFTLDPRDVPSFKLMNSPRGSNCKDLIGTDCKCGPFTIASSNGEAQAGIPYEIEGPQGVQSGCTDAKGKTIAVNSPVTGTCTVRLLRASKSGQCAAPAPAANQH